VQPGDEYSNICGNSEFNDNGPLPACKKVYMEHGDREFNLFPWFKDPNGKTGHCFIMCDEEGHMYGSADWRPIPVAHPENGNAPWATPPGKLLFVAEAQSIPADSPTNRRKCAMVDGDKVRHKPCVWEDKNFYWEKAPDGKVKSIVTGKCIGPDLSAESTTGSARPFYVKMIDCSSQGAGILMKKTGGKPEQSGFMKVVIKYTYKGQVHDTCMAETPLNSKRNSGANKDRASQSMSGCGFKGLALHASWFFS
jgi:hypothetical protein